MAPALDAAATRSPHKRNDYDGPNLAVLIPVVIILTIVAVVFFGWFGLPWPKIMAWWKRKRTRTSTTSTGTAKDDDQELEHHDRRPSAQPSRAEPEPGSALSYAKAFERSHIDALKLANLGGDDKARSKKDDKKLRSGLQRALQGDALALGAAPGDARPSGSWTPDLASGQMTPGQQSTLSAVPERRASPWDPTRTKD
jgi:hypothetical protein